MVLQVLPELETRVLFRVEKEGAELFSVFNNWFIFSRKETLLSHDLAEPTVARSILSLEEVISDLSVCDGSLLVRTKTEVLLFSVLEEETRLVLKQQEVIKSVNPIFLANGGRFVTAEKKRMRIFDHLTDIEEKWRIEKKEDSPKSVLELTNRTFLCIYPGSVSIVQENLEVLRRGAEWLSVCAEEQNIFILEKENKITKLYPVNGWRSEHETELSFDLNSLVSS